MQKQPARLWITALFLGWLLDFLFFKHSPGLNFAIYALVTLSGGLILLWLDGLRPARATWWLFPLFLFFIVFSVLRQEPLSAVLAHGLTLFMMTGVAVSYRGGQWPLYSLADYFVRGLDLVGSLVARPIRFFTSLRPAKDEAGNAPKSITRIFPVLRGVFFAVPVVAFFAALLASADLIFAQRLASITALFSIENLPEYIFRFTYIIVAAYALAGVYLHAAQRSTDEKLLGLEKPLIPAFLGFTEAGIVLGSVVLLFAAFVMIQFQYFFGGQANINLSGFTYAEYVHKGFGELVTVAFFALLLFLGLSTITRRETLLRQRFFSGLGVTLLALVAVILVSAYQRLVLYEDAYGFTRLRTYIHIFMIWVGVLLASVVLLNLFKRQRAFALAALLAGLGFSASLLLLNVDAFIVQRNLSRFEQGQALDVGYLATLSPDAVPALVNAYAAPGAPAVARDRVGAVLACIQFADSNRSARDKSWQAFNLSDYWAANALGPVVGSLSGYQIDKTNWPASVTTPMDLKFDCYSSTGE